MESEQTPTRKLIIGPPPLLDSTSSSCSTPGPTSLNAMHTQSYRIRYLLLVIFIVLSLSNSFQWIEYAVIESIITDYYSVSTFWVNCTSVVFMVSYILGIMPATWMLKHYGLRKCLILGSFSNALGSWIKCFSLDPSMFWLSMLGQSMVATAQLFILNIPPVLSATWFPSHQVSTVTSYGVFGNQVGIALGFLLPSLIVPPINATQVEFGFITNTKQGLGILFYSVAILATIIFVTVVAFFRDAPPVPPSEAAALSLSANSRQSFLDTLRSLFTNINFVLLLLSYGLNTGVFYALSTTLAQMITKSLGDTYLKHTGLMGLLMVVAGMVGAVVCGHVLDYSKRYKAVTVFVYSFSLLSAMGWGLGLELRSLYYLYGIAFVLGFFMTGYLPIGFEFGAEISYPQPEGISAGLLNAAAQVFGIALTFSSSEVLSRYGCIYANAGFVAALVIGLVLTILIKNDLRRQNAHFVARVEL